MSGQEEFFGALLDPERITPNGLTTWNGSDATTRFAIYRNNVVASLIDALAKTCPVTLQLVGEEFFRGMARLFIAAQPPRSRVLAFFGEELPDFIEHFAPASSVPYLADVARLEFLRVRAFHAHDASQLPVQTIAQFLAKPDELPGLVVELHPSLGLLRSQYAVVSLWGAHQGIAEISSVDPFVGEDALIIRPQLEVEVLRLGSGAADFITHLAQGASLGSAATQASDVHADFNLTTTIGLLVQHHCILSLNK